MIKLTNKFLIFLVIVIIFIGGYLYFSNGSKSEAATTSPDGSLSSTTATDASFVTSSTSPVSEKIASDIAFISKLASLNKIKIDTSLFSNKLFTKLTDNNIEIEAGAVGRSNPFALIGLNETKGTVIVSQVITKDATQITDKSAILNGTVSESTATSVYFEYGTNEALGNITGPLKQSLIGGFNTIITGLTSKTTYLYRAVSKINNVLVYGDIISFKTN
jgi:hypothetical protein